MRHARIMVSTALAATLALAAGCGDSATEVPKTADKMETGKMATDEMKGGKMDDKMAAPK